MKFTTVVSIFVLASVLYVTLASSSRSNKKKVEKVQSEVLSYVYQKMGGLRMMRGNSANLSCYDEFIPLVNSLATQAKQASVICVENATHRRDEEVELLKNLRLEVEYEVAKITNNLANCSVSVGIDYFNCLSRNADYNIDILDSIRYKCYDINSEYDYRMAYIDHDEQKCLNVAVDSAKTETDKAFEDLRECLITGLTKST